MRTTVVIDPDLHAAALAEAARERITLSSLINQALRRSLRPIPPVTVDSVTGLGVVSLGHPVSVEDVADALDD